MDTFADWQVPTWVMVLVVGVLTISLVIGVPLARMAGNRRGRRLAHPELLTTKRQKATDTALFLAALVPSVLVWLAVMGVSFIGLTGFAARVMSWTHWTNMLVPLSLDGISVSFGAWAFVAVKRGRHPGRAYKIVLAAATMSAVLNFVHGQEEWSVWAGIYLAFLSFTGMAMFHEMLEQFMAAYDEETALRSRYPRFGQRWLYAPISTFAARRAWIVNPPREPLPPSIRNALEHLEYVREERRLYRLGGATRVREEQQARLVEIQARMQVKAAKRGDAASSPADQLLEPPPPLPDSGDVLERVRRELSPQQIRPVTAAPAPVPQPLPQRRQADSTFANSAGSAEQHQPAHSVDAAAAGARHGLADSVARRDEALESAPPADDLLSAVDAASALEQAAPPRRRRGKEVTAADPAGVPAALASAEPVLPAAGAVSAAVALAAVALPVAEPAKARRRGAKAGAEEGGVEENTPILAAAPEPAEAPLAEKPKRRTKAAAARTDESPEMPEQAAETAAQEPTQAERPKRRPKAAAVPSDEPPAAPERADEPPAAPEQADEPPAASERAAQTAEEAAEADAAEVMAGSAQAAGDAEHERWRLEVPKSGWQRIGEASDSGLAGLGADGAGVPLLFGAPISRPVLPERVPQILDAHMRPGDDLSVVRLTNLVLRALGVPASRDAVDRLVRTWVAQIEKGTRGYLEGPRPTPEPARPFGQKLEYPFDVLTLQKVVINHRAVACPDCGTEESLMFSGQHKRRPIEASCGCGQRWPIVGLGSERVGEALVNEIALGQAELLRT